MAIVTIYVGMVTLTLGSLRLLVAMNYPDFYFLPITQAQQWTSVVICLLLLKVQLAEF